MNAYSLDFRIRLLNHSLNHSVRETAVTFRVSPATVQRLKKLFLETGQLAPRPGSVGRPRVVSEEGELFLKVLLLEEVDLTLEELRERYFNAYGVQVSLGAMHDTLQRLDLPRKKKPPTIRRKTPKSTGPTRSATTSRSMDSPLKSVSISMKPEPASI
jgi:transposase